MSRLALPHSLLRLAELLAQFVQSLRNLRFSSIRIGIDAAAQPVRRSLHMVVQIGVIHTGQRIAQLLRNPRLIGSHLTFRITDAFLQLGQLIGELLALLRKHASDPLPPIFVKALQRWEQNGTEARVESLVVLKVTRPEVLKELQASKAARFLGVSLGTTTVVIQPGAQAKVMEALAELGILAEARLDGGE